MTTTVKIVGESNEATITIDPTGAYFGFECSKGAWCQHSPIWSPDLRLVIENARAHVTRHDDEDVARTGSAPAHYDPAFADRLENGAYDRG